MTRAIVPAPASALPVERPRPLVRLGGTWLRSLSRFVSFARERSPESRIDRARSTHARILYLRSFAGADSARILREAVAPAVTSTGSLACLVHPSQKEAARASKPWGRAPWTTLGAGIADPDWRAWYLQQLESAMAVIVDAPFVSPSTQWEIDVARGALGRDRVAVIAPRGQGWHFPGFLVFEVRAERLPDLDAALARWIGWVLEVWLDTLAD